MTTDTIHRIALLVDFENIILGLPQSKKLRAKAVMLRVLELGKIVVKRAYADWGRYENHKVELHQLGFELMEIPHRSVTGKNSADIRLVVEAMDLVISKEHIDTFVLVSGDSDFTPLVAKLREHDKRVVGIGVKQSTSKLLVDSCDEFIYYEEIDDVSTDTAGAGEKLAKTHKAKGGRQLDRLRAEALYLVVDAARALLREYDAVWASQIKQTIKRKHPSFSESYHGFPTFGALIETATQVDLLEGKLDEKSGNWRIKGLGDKAASMFAAPVASA
ncbi:MAG: NYN domain-containing protein [Vicinamibacterales bacterium]